MQPKTHLEEWSITNNDTNQILHRSEEGIMITEEGTSVKFLGINPINDKFTNYNSSEFSKMFFISKQFASHLNEIIVFRLIVQI